MSNSPSTFKDLVELVVDFINLLIPLLFGVLFVFLIWKIIDAWVINAGDESKRTAGKQYVIAAVIAFVVMLSAWGVVALLRSFLFG